MGKLPQSEKKSNALLVSEDFRANKLLETKMGLGRKSLVNSNKPSNTVECQKSSPSSVVHGTMEKRNTESHVSCSQKHILVPRLTMDFLAETSSISVGLLWSIQLTMAKLSPKLLL